MAKPQGLWVDILPSEKFYRVNGLKIVTNPIYLDKNSFTPDGVLSNEIFGSSSRDRRQRYAMIDLGGHFMQPLAAVRIDALDRKVANCLYSQGLYKLTSNGELVEDDEGGSGPEYLYSIWDKIKVKPKTTESTKIVEEFYALPKDVLFTTMFPVEPAFYRDINQTEFSQSKATATINSKYAQIISLTNSMRQYTSGSYLGTRLTQSRVQSLLVEIYDLEMVQKVKGKPSKFGLLRTGLAGKTIPYSSRLVITAPDLCTESLERTQVKFGYASVPLQYVCAEFMPFMVQALKGWFEQQFIQSGSYIIGSGFQDDKQTKPIVFERSYNEQEISHMLRKFINSPATRFDVIPLPSNNSNLTAMAITGKYHRENTTFMRPATYTDVFYIVANYVVNDKHTFITRYPIDNPNNQNPYRIIITSTTKTKPATIGNTVYDFYPLIEGDPLNSFMSTLQFSNTMDPMMNADYDGDQTSVKPNYSIEANADSERIINSKRYILNVAGKNMRTYSKDFVLTQYTLSKSDPEYLTADCNLVPPEFVV